MAVNAGNVQYDELSMDELAVRAKSGDEDALRKIYAESREMLRSKANLYYMVGADRDDIIQEGMIGLFSAIRTFDPDVGASFKTFSELCVKRRIINAVKLANRKKHMPLNESVSIGVTIANTGDNAETIERLKIEDTLQASYMTNPDEIVLLADLLEFVENNAVSLFSNMEREVWQAYSRGENVEKITKKLGRSKKTVDNTLTRIKRKIEKLISLY